MKLKKLKKMTHSVKVVNDVLDVGVMAKPFIVTVFEASEVAPLSTALGPLGGLDLTGYSEYRLTLHFVGAEGTEFSIQEMSGPVGTVDQITFEIGNGQIGSQGILNYRATFDVFGPKNLFIQISNQGDAPFQVDGTLYAVH